MKAASEVLDPIRNLGFPLCNYTNTHRYPSTYTDTKATCQNPILVLSLGLSQFHKPRMTMNLWVLRSDDTESGLHVNQPKQESKTAR